MRTTLIGAAALLVAVAACGGGAGAPSKRGTAPSYATVATQVLWSVQRTTASPDTLAQVEAELGTRGQTSFAGAYLGERTADFYGARLFPRGGPGRGDRDCGDFPSAAAAQRYFLSTGGPQYDDHGLDRDGDGLACEWGAALTASRRAALSTGVPARVVPGAATRAGLTRRADPVPTLPTARTPSTARTGSLGRCYTGPRGGTYTLTASGGKNYDGC